MTDEDSDSSDADVDSGIAQHKMGVVARMIQWFGGRNRASAAKLSRQNKAGSRLNKTLDMLDKQAAIIQREIKRTESKLQTLYKHHSTHPEVYKKLHIILAKQKAEAA